MSRIAKKEVHGYRQGTTTEYDMFLEPSRRGATGSHGIPYGIQRRYHGSTGYEMDSKVRAIEQGKWLQHLQNVGSLVGLRSPPCRRRR